MADEHPGIIKGVEVFTTGTWSGSKRVTVDSAMLDRIVANFAQLNAVPGFGVPVKLGHNSRIGEPAMGWVTALSREGDKLVADLGDVPVDLVDKIGKRQYNSVSVELWPKVEHQGQVFTDVLGAVALLGAEWPAVKGLKPLSASLFAEAGVEKIELSSKEQPVTLKFTQEDHDALVAAAVAKAIADKDAEVTTATQRATLAETALETFRADAATKAAEVLIDGAITAGKVLPKQKEELMAMATAFGAKVTFKVGATEKNGLDMFKAFLDGLPTKITYGERGAAQAEKPGDGQEKVADVVHAAAQDEINKAGGPSKLAYADAVKLAFAKDPALKTRYAQEG